MRRSARNREILSILRDRLELTVEEACSIFKISQATARRDFATLAEEGKAEKTWGGLRYLDTQTQSILPSGVRENLYTEAKQRIAERAAALCSDGDIVFVDGGTTTLQMARWLSARRLRIVTNSLLVAHSIDRLRSGPRGPEVFVTGGYLFQGSGLLVGPESIESLRKYRAAVAFMSVGGLSEEGVTNNHHLVVEVERMMISRAEKIVLLADHSKFNRHELVPECSWEEVDNLVTDRDPGDQYKDILGERLVLAENKG